MTKSRWLKLLRSGSLWGVLTTAIGALTGPPVLAVFPTSVAGILIVLGSLITALSQSLPQLILDIMDESHVDLGEDRQSGTGT